MPSLKHFISTHELSRGRLEALIDRALAWKRGMDGAPLDGKSVALIFMNPSLRTRVSMEVAVAELGGRAVTIDSGSAWKLEFAEGAVMDGDRAEHIKDAARVLSRYVSAIGLRCFAGLEDREQDLADPVIEGFRRHASVPVINLESARWHPCQALADAMTIVERHGSVAGKKVVLTWAYHPKPLPQAVPNSFATIMKQLGAELTVARPPAFDLGLDVATTDSMDFAGADVVYAKSWAAPLIYESREDEARRRAEYRSWCVRDTKGATFMHCLPVRRNVVVADAVLDGSAVYDQAENRLHAQKAVLEALLG